MAKMTCDVNTQGLCAARRFGGSRPLGAARRQARRAARGRQDVATARLCSRHVHSCVRRTSQPLRPSRLPQPSRRSRRRVVHIHKMIGDFDAPRKPGIVAPSAIPARQRRSQRRLASHMRRAQSHRDHRDDPMQSSATHRIAGESRKKRPASLPQDARTNACGDCPLASDDASALPLRLRQQH